MVTATQRPIFAAAAYPAGMPHPGATSPAGFQVAGTTLMYVGSIGVPFSKSPVGWLPQARLKVDGGFMDALAAAQQLAQAGADATKFAPPGQSTRTHLAAVIQGADGVLHIAPLFVQSFDDGQMRRSAFGTSMWRNDEFMPGTHSTVVALAGPKSWIDARPGHEIPPKPEKPATS